MTISEMRSLSNKLTVDMVILRKLTGKYLVAKLRLLSEAASLLQ
jgi:hypothetical protein